MYISHFSKKCRLCKVVKIKKKYLSQMVYNLKRMTKEIAVAAATGRKICAGMNVDICSPSVKYDIYHFKRYPSVQLVAGKEILLWLILGGMGNSLCISLRALLPFVPLLKHCTPQNLKTKKLVAEQTSCN